MRFILRALGFLLFHVGRYAVRVPRGALNLLLDAVYGPPIVPQATGYNGAKATTASDFKQTLPQSAPSRAAPSPVSDKSLDALVLRSGQATTPAAQPNVSERVHLAEVVGPSGLVYGVMWLYLYPDQRFAKRVFKVSDRKLAKALKKDRYFMDQVPYDPQVGSAGIMEDMHKEVTKLLDRRQSAVRERTTEIVPRLATAPNATAFKPAPAPTATAPRIVPVPVRAPVPPLAAPPVPAAAAPTRHVKRHVEGEVYEGIVTVAQMTTRNEGSPNSYKTFCLTLNDGRREVPLYGTELQRQITDLKVECGDRVKVVFMGKADTEVPGKGKAMKNLYQVMRLPA